MDLTNEDVADILALLDSLPYDELDLQTSKFRLTLRRTPGAGWTETREVTAEPQVIAEPEILDADLRREPDTTAGGARAAQRAGASEQRASLINLTSPLPGTFYRAPRPGAAPFVEVGSVVSEDTVVAIVESMKLMNTVHAGTRGRVAEICVGNAEPVTQGAVLLRIDPEAT